MLLANQFKTIPKYFLHTNYLQNLLLTNLETHSTNLEELRDNVTFAVNITATRLKLNGNSYVRYIYICILYNYYILYIYKVIYSTLINLLC